MVSLRVLSSHQTPCDLVRCLACSAIPHPKTCTNHRGVCPAPPCHGLLSPSSWCCLLLLSCNSLWQSASSVPLALRSYSSLQTSKRSRDWAGSAHGYPTLMVGGGWSGTAAEVGSGVRGMQVFSCCRTELCILLEGFIQALLHMTFHVRCEEW